jgi:hypothetical protein
VDVDELLAVAGRIIRDTGWAHYFAPATLARGGELGFDPLQFHVIGRGGVLGDVEASVVRSAFGYFNPAVIEKAWNGGRQVMAPRDAAREHMACCALHGPTRSSGVDRIDRFVSAADETAHFVKRPNDIKRFGWTEADAAEISDDTLAPMSEAETLTDRMVRPAFAALNQDRRPEFVDVLAIHTALSAG